MKAAVINHYGGREQLEVIDMPIPKIKSDEVLVENMATSINPIDYKAREGLLKRMFPWQFPVILGWDIAGIVASTGDDVTSFKVGDP
ncbi:MAG: alcohol dehydrogenase catalytic domain-containing protein, partial [Leuconostoc mesenteroides]